MRMEYFAPLLRSQIGVQRPFHLLGNSVARPQSQRRRPGLRWVGAIHRRHDDDDDPPPAPAAMRLAVPNREDAQHAPGPAMLWAA